MPRVAILGTGLIGGSIGLRLKAARPELEVVGFDSFREHSQAAERGKAIDRVAHSPREAVTGAGLVIFAAPILAIRDLMQEVAPALEPGVIATDTGSTKAEVMRWARELLPAEASFVGGHPMAGKTEAGPSAAEATLFEGARWAIVPSSEAAEDAVDVVTGLALAMGARPMFLDAEEHDAYVAAISHLPLMVATALFRLTRDSEAWPELSMLAAGGFRDTSRLAGTDPAMAHDIAVTNRTQLIHWIERYIETLRSLQRQVADVEGEQELFRVFAQTNLEHGAFMSGAIGRKEIDEAHWSAVPETSLMDLLLGGTMAERAREMTRRSEERLAEAERRAKAGGRG
ncbi:MAG: prephenate dehydrogenase/arogenate dehydrogenase family protein [Dehalococcoidia bacterium]|nr:prephenate dehydrogenase/arogenate dehydrogenase family protein [Dehalococcoidia bacterium]HRC61990.1 prephenate dehydrogenase/arogenate dehydrogenase family protein [Dehalococcoidia bacterium]